MTPSLWPVALIQNTNEMQRFHNTVMQVIVEVNILRHIMKLLIFVVLFYSFFNQKRRKMGITKKHGMEEDRKRRNLPKKQGKVFIMGITQLLLYFIKVALEI